MRRRQGTSPCLFSCCWHYEVMGEGRPLLLIHGLDLDTRMWDAQFTEFARTHQVIRFDLRGMGQTPMSDQPFRLYDDVKGLLDALGIEKTCVAGLSFGGYTALEFALAYPDRVEGLILVSSGLLGHPRSEKRQQDAARFAELCRTGTVEEITETAAQYWFDGPGQPPNREAAEARERFRMMFAQAYALPKTNQSPTWLTPGPIERLEEIKVPTLVVAGDRDYEDFLAISEILAQRIPRAQKVIMAGSAHIPPMDQPETFNRLVRQFLASLT